MTDPNTRPLIERIRTTPIGRSPDWDASITADIIKSLGDDPGAALFEQADVRAFVGGICSGSSYLSGIIRRKPNLLVETLQANPETHLRVAIETLRHDMRAAPDAKTAMTVLRQFKERAAFVIALADLGGVWSVMTVTRALSDIADAAVAESVAYQFRTAVQKGDWTDTSSDAPEMNSGYFVLAMGKHGAHELNFSSDIDLIVFYERDAAQLREGLEPQTFFVKLTQQVHRFMNEHTSDGYVFRTDLRLRPDPGATPVAISTASALHYYESFGQNWERAAMIKARPIAGDELEGQRFLKDLAPFIWRKYLDYATISDIHAMKRQIHAHKGFGKISLAGHNIKLGRGGIREIEFFAQTQQLIAGGRQIDIRTRDTLTTLDRLVERGWVLPAVRDELAESYRFLRFVEHRIQMVADEQTQQLPRDAEQLESLARFSGYADVHDFEADLQRHFETVVRHYAALFEDDPGSGKKTLNLVFTGEDDDPGTLATLEELGFTRPAQVVSIIRSWHRGRHPAVRSEQARQRLTRVQPLLIEALADTIDPDAALVGFDRFLRQLPAGIQLFALLRAHPEMMQLVAAIVGSAPRLSDILSRRRRVIDAVLDPGIIGDVPGEGEIAHMVGQELALADSFEDALDRARIVGSEQKFLIGIRLLTGTISASRAGGAYALLAEEVVRQLKSAVLKDFSLQHGHVDNGAAAVVALGKLGGREMTAASDLDLIIVYHADETAEASVGPRPLAISQYFARLTQRLISALSAPTSEGFLYEVDTRLRPSGHKGPIATRLTSFVDYQATQAWTWEHMALTRARVISGPDSLREAIEDAITTALQKPRDARETATYVREMRARIAAEKGTEHIWDLKQVAGGLVDIEFTCQYLQLIHAHDNPGVLDQNTATALEKLRDAGFLEAEIASRLLAGHRLISNLTQILRLCTDTRFEPEKAPNGLKALLARAADAPTFENLEEHLRATLQETHAIYRKILGEPDAP